MGIKIPTARDIQKALPKRRDIQRAVSGSRIREPLPAKKKKQALEKAKNTCQWPRCNVKNSYVKLQFHHINMKNDDNRLSNIKVLCPTHHQLIHQKIKRIVEKDITGREVKSRIKKVKPKKKTKKKRNKTPLPFGMLQPSRKWI